MGAGALVGTLAVQSIYATSQMSAVLPSNYVEVSSSFHWSSGAIQCDIRILLFPFNTFIVGHYSPIA